MEIVALNKTALLEYVNSTVFKAEENLPISEHRAVSHANNPRANVNDVLLFLAKEGDELIGYMGILPDLFFPKNQPIVKVGWVTCAWVKKEHRGKGITAKLFTEAHFKYNGNLLSYDYVPATKRMYDATGFFAQKPLVKHGVRLYIKSDFERILAPKSKVFKKSATVLKGLDSAGNNLLKLYQSGKAFPIDHLNLEAVTEINDPLNEFIAEQNDQGYFQRQARELNWILSSPWIVERDEKTEMDQKYYFSSSAKEFKNLAFQLKDEHGKIVAFFFFTIRNGVVKLPYFFGNTDDKENVLIINHLLQKWKAKEFTCFHPKLVSALQEAKTIAFHKKEINRFLVVDKQLSKSITHVNLFMEDGDGDAVFT
jgi:GNAT superfamily N-acetyltransferase